MACKILKNPLGVADITSSIQRKTEKIQDNCQSDSLLSNLIGDGVDGELEQSSSKPTCDMMAAGWNPTAEPQAHLPLWRRVDRRFWWNEGILQHFVSAGVSSFEQKPIRLYANKCAPLASRICPSCHARIYPDEHILDGIPCSI